MNENKQKLLDDIVLFTDPETYHGFNNCLIQQVRDKVCEPSDPNLDDDVVVSEHYNVPLKLVSRIYARSMDIETASKAIAMATDVLTGAEA